MAFNKKFFTTGGIVASSGACLTETTDIFGDSSGKLLYSFDTDASDASGVYNGTPTDVDFGVSGKINTGVRFPQTTSQRIQFTNPISNASNADFNVSFFVKFRSITGTAPNFAYVLVGNPANQYGPFQIYTYYHASGLVFMLQRSVSGSVYYSTNYDTDIPVSVTANTYHHISINYTASSYGIEIFKDGVSAGTSTLDQASVLTQLTTSSLGYNDSNAANALAGSLDQFRIFNRKLTSGSGSEIETLVNEQACVHTSTTDDINFPVTNAAYYKLDNSAEDSKGTNDGTETDIEYRFGRYGQAAVFNGSSSAIELATGINVNNNFSWSAWVKWDSFADSEAVIAFQASFRNYLDVLSASNKSLGFYDGVQLTSPNNSIDTGNWYHIVITKGSSLVGGKARIMYVNGIEVASDTSTTNSISGSGKNLIGAYNSGSSTGAYFDGSIDQVRVFHSVLSPENVTKLYNEKPETDTSNFKAVLYKGTGVAGLFISNVGMDLETSGGLVWIKDRDEDGYFHQLYDSVRGSIVLFSNSTLNEFSRTGVSSFENNGFFLGTHPHSNQANKNTVAWVWKGGGAAVSNGNGSITSSVSANTAAGFSIVSYTGTSTIGDTIGHGLGTPDLIIVKNRDNSSASWAVWSSAFTSASQTLFLNSNNVSTDFTNRFGTVNSTTFQAGSSGGTEVNASGNKFIAYIFKSVAGYSSIGTYTWQAASSTAGTMVTGLGFTPSFVMIKGITIAGDWQLYDNRRVSGTQSYALWADLDDAESTSGFQGIIFDNDGFSAGVGADGNTTSSSSLNIQNNTYLYMAIK
jgi:hypothetical protein